MVRVNGMDLPSLVLLDLDGTLTPVRSPWKYVYERLGTWDSRGKDIMNRYLAKEIDYVSFCRLDMEAWEEAGADLETIEKILDEIPFPKQALDFIVSLAEAGVRTTLISTGFERVALNLARQAGLPPSSTFRMAINGIRRFNGHISPVLRVHEGDSHKGKGAWAKRLVRLSGVPPERTFAIGDGSSDRLMFPHVGRGFPVRGSGDLSRVLSRILTPLA